MYRHADGVSRWVSTSLLILGLVVSGAGVASAQDAPAKSPPEAEALYADAANFQNNGSFELAVEEWQRFLAKYPKDPLAPKAQHYLGVCQLQLKNFSKAAEAFAAVVANYPKFEMLEDAYLNLGWCLYSLGGDDPKHYEAAAKTFADMLKAFPKGKFTDQALYFQGEAYYQLGQKAEAAAAYDALVTDFPKSNLRADALYALGVTLEETQQWKEAGAAYDLFLKEFSESDLTTEVQMRKAETVLQTGDPAAAEKLFAAAASAKDFPSADHALYRQAYAVTLQGDDARAAALYDQLAASFPNSAYVKEANLAAGRSYYRAQKFAEAAAAFEKVVAGDPANAAEAAHWLCRIYIARGEPDKAVDLASKVIPDAQESKFLVNLKLDQADALYEQPAKKADSLPLYLKIVSDHPEDPLAATALYNAAFTSLALKSYDESLKLAEDFLARYPKHELAIDSQYIAAESHLQLGNYAEAEAGYQAVTAEGVKHNDLDLWRVRLGLSLYLQKKYQEVVASLSGQLAALKNPSHVAEAQFLIGASQFALDKLAEAATALNASLAADPKSAQAEEAHLFLSRTLRKLGKFDEAIETLRSLIASFPNSRLIDQAHYYLADALAAKGDAAAAIGEYDLVISGSPESKFVPYALYGKGLAQQSAKQHAEAAASFSALLEGYPEHELAAKGDVHFARALSLRQAGNYVAAIQDLDAFLKTDPPAEVKDNALLERGLAQVGQKDFAAAVTTFDTILKDNPKYPAADKVLYELAWAYKSQDKAAEAVANFARLATEFPDSATAPEAWFHVGESQYAEKNYAEAARSFANSVAKAPTAELKEKAAYMLGWTHYQQKNYQGALEQFTAQTTAHPEGALFADGLFMKGECLFKLGQYAEALPALAAALQTGKLSAKVEPLVLLHAGQAAAQEKQWADSIKYLAVIPEKHKESPYVSEAHYELGWAQKNNGQPDDALKNLEVAATMHRGDVGARARFMIGEIYFEKKDFEEASRQYQRCMFGYGGDAAPAEVKNWQAKSGFSAARCAEVQISEAKDARKRADAIATAKRFYTFVVEKHPNSELAPEAKKRLDVLAKL